MRHHRRLLFALGLVAVAGAAVPVAFRIAEARDRAKAERGPLTIEEVIRLAGLAGYRLIGDTIWRPAQPGQWGSWRTDRTPEHRERRITFTDAFLAAQADATPADDRCACQIPKFPHTVGYHMGLG